MTPVLAPSVYCKNPNCLFASQPILLPFPNPPGVFEGQSGWPTDTWKAYIACFECGLVYEYLAKDGRWGYMLAILWNTCLYRFGHHHRRRN